jgi:7-cyano-7-deazaguanine synthase
MTTEKARSLVLLSGGIDSATCLALRCVDGPPPVALAVAYGQPNACELDRAARLAGHYRCELVTAGIALPWPRPPFADADEPSETNRPRHYVPARNLVLLSIAMAVAESRDLDRVYLGTTVDDWRYPDTRAAFIEAFGEAVRVGLQRGHEGRPIVVRTPLAGLRKVDVLRLALGLGVPLELTWSCFGAGPRPCGTCGACAVRREAFAALGAEDPAG